MYFKSHNQKSYGNEFLNKHFLLLDCNKVCVCVGIFFFPHYHEHLFELDKRVKMEGEGVVCVFVFCFVVYLFASPPPPENTIPTSPEKGPASDGLLHRTRTDLHGR